MEDLSDLFWVRKEVNGYEYDAFFYNLITGKTKKSNDIYPYERLIFDEPFAIVPVDCNVLIKWVRDAPVFYELLPGRRMRKLLEKPACVRMNGKYPVFDDIPTAYYREIDREAQQTVDDYYREIDREEQQTVDDFLSREESPPRASPADSVDRTPPRASTRASQAAAVEKSTPTSVMVSSPHRYSTDNKYWVSIIPADKWLQSDESAYKYYNIKTGEKTIGPPVPMIEQKHKLFANIQENVPFHIRWDESTQSPVFEHKITHKTTKIVPHGVNIFIQPENFPSEWVPEFIDKFLGKNPRFDHVKNKFRIQGDDPTNIYRKGGDVIWQVSFRSCLERPNRDIMNKLEDTHVHFWGDLKASSRNNIGIGFHVYFKHPYSFALKVQTSNHPRMLRDGTKPTFTGENFLYLSLENVPRSSFKFDSQQYTVLLDRDKVDEVGDAGNVYVATEIADLLESFKLEPALPKPH